METRNYVFYVLTSDIAPNEIRYVGVTTQKTINKRLTLHKYYAVHPEKRGLPVHKWMYSVYKQGGSINITEIDRCLENEWENREQTLIQKYKDAGHKLLNVDKGGNGVITKEKRSIDSITRSTEAHKKAVTAYNLDGTKYKDFSSITEAAQEVNGEINNICSVLNNHSKSACGYMWKYKSDIVKIDPYKKEQIGIKIYQFDLLGKLIKKFDSKNDVLTALGIKGHHPLDEALRNKTQYKRFYWSTTSDIDISTFVYPYKYKISSFVDSNYNVYVIEQKEISEILGISKSTVCAKLKKTSNFEYKEFFVETI